MFHAGFLVKQLNQEMKINGIELRHIAAIVFLICLVHVVDVCVCCVRCVLGLHAVQCTNRCIVSYINTGITPPKLNG